MSILEEINQRAAAYAQLMARMRPSLRALSWELLGAGSDLISAKAMARHREHWHPITGWDSKLRAQLRRNSRTAVQHAKAAWLQVQAIRAMTAPRRAA